MEANALVREYLGRLEEAAQVLPAERRRELAAEIAEHIDAALAAAPKRDEVAVRNVLERLGDPEEIVAAEAGSARPVASSRLGAIEVGGLVLLAGGTLLSPFLGLFALLVSFLGLALLWASSAWTSLQKTIATLIFAALILLPVILLLAAGAGGGTN